MYCIMAVEYEWWIQQKAKAVAAGWGTEYIKLNDTQAV